jgi:chemotaxis protein MotB
MSASGENKRPIIVKRKAAHHDDHGGQWKVAYADFVTAMMAFFLIMWLLSSATSADRQVIAKYFTSSSLFDLPAGNGVLNGGRSVMDGSDSRPSRGAPSNKDNAGQSDSSREAKAAAAAAAASAQDRTERQRFEAMKAELEHMLTSGDMKAVSGNVDITITSEGLRIQIFDRDGQPMFAPASSEPSARLKMVLQVVAQVLKTVQNSVILSGHTDSQPLTKASYSNWELSSDRANAVRRTLETDGLAAGRVIRVEGRGAADPLLPQTPLDARNRRIAVTILRTDLEKSLRDTQ